MKKGSQKLRAKKEQLHIRLSATEKSLFKELQETTGYTGSTDIFRELITETAKLAMKYSDGALSPEELEKQAGQIVASLIIPNVQEAKEAKKMKEKQGKEEE